MSTTRPFAGYWKHYKEFDRKRSTQQIQGYLKTIEAFAADIGYQVFLEECRKIVSVTELAYFYEQNPLQTQADLERLFNQVSQCVTHEWVFYFAIYYSSWTGSMVLEKDKVFSLYDQLIIQCTIEHSTSNGGSGEQQGSLQQILTAIVKKIGYDNWKKHLKDLNINRNVGILKEKYVVGAEFISNMDVIETRHQLDNLVCYSGLKDTTFYDLQKGLNIHPTLLRNLPAHMLPQPQNSSQSAAQQQTFAPNGQPQQVLGNSNQAQQQARFNNQQNPRSAGGQRGDARQNNQGFIPGLNNDQKAQLLEIFENSSPKTNANNKGNQINPNNPNNPSNNNDESSGILNQQNQGQYQVLVNSGSFSDQQPVMNPNLLNKQQQQQEVQQQQQVLNQNNNNNVVGHIAPSHLDGLPQHQNFMQLNQEPQEIVGVPVPCSQQQQQHRQPAQMGQQVFHQNLNAQQQQQNQNQQRQWQQVQMPPVQQVQAPQIPVPPQNLFQKLIKAIVAVKQEKHESHVRNVTSLIDKMTPRLFLKACQERGESIMEFIGPEIEENGGNVKKAVEVVGEFIAEVVWEDIMEAAGGANAVQKQVN